jgi:hypothetical protein
VGTAELSLLSSFENNIKRVRFPELQFAVSRFHQRSARPSSAKNNHPTTRVLTRK